MIGCFLYPPGVPEMFLPVDIIKAGDDHAFTGWGMEEFAIFYVDTDMTDLGSRLKENQISGAKFVFADLAAKPRKLGGGPGDLPAKFVPEGKIYEPRAVHPFFTQAAFLVSDSFPFFVLWI